MGNGTGWGSERRRTIIMLQDHQAILGSSFFYCFPEWKRWLFSDWEVFGTKRQEWHTPPAKTQSAMQKKTFPIPKYTALIQNIGTRPWQWGLNNPQRPAFHWTGSNCISNSFALVFEGSFTRQPRHNSRLVPRFLRMGSGESILMLIQKWVLWNRASGGAAWVTVIGYASRSAFYLGFAVALGHVWGSNVIGWLGPHILIRTISSVRREGPRIYCKSAMHGI